MGGMVGLWGANSLIKSIQRGTITISNPAITNTATITAVNMDNAVLRWTGWEAGGVSQADHNMANLVFTNSTTITSNRAQAGVSTATNNFIIIEYKPGVIKSIQRAQGAVPTTPTAFTITAVSSIDRTEEIWLGLSCDSTSSALSIIPRITLTSTTNVNYNLQSPYILTIVSFQVVEWF